MQQLFVVTSINEALDTKFLPDRLYHQMVGGYQRWLNCRNICCCGGMIYIYPPLLLSRKNICLQFPGFLCVCLVCQRAPPAPPQLILNLINFLLLSSCKAVGQSKVLFVRWNITYKYRSNTTIQHPIDIDLVICETGWFKSEFFPLSSNQSLV